MNCTPKFIVFEGIDGAGKTTQIVRLSEYLASKGISCITTAEPTDSEGGRHIRRILSGEISATNEELATLFAKDREYHNTCVGGIEQTLSDGVTVISDRYYYSSLAYQGADVGLDKVMALNIGNPHIRRPDLCIFLDLTPEQSLERIGVRDGEAREIFENTDTLRRTRAKFYEVFDILEARGEKIVKIDASRSIDEIARDIAQAVDGLF